MTRNRAATEVKKYDFLKKKRKTTGWFDGSVLCVEVLGDGSGVGSVFRGWAVSIVVCEVFGLIFSLFYIGC